MKLQYLAFIKVECVGNRIFEIVKKSIANSDGYELSRVKKLFGLSLI